MTANADIRPDHFKLAERRGTFDRIDSKFRNFISSEPGARVPPEKDRYICASLTGRFPRFGGSGNGSPSKRPRSST
ncbi:hypothetical protein HO173_006170 [Letharia columbiana]|uniref:Uncharacterized protein n=1 Tax=Letharia columbiana TaxID=112416 RepID=A0A8H6L4S2_9LECA|nr:uncharacterized protein HO173_006170 [Letharia columbiana]KAF6235487.1 hypothetical protein HO173_006170 [Letharia columbiana]